jgi:hypothetical protein
MHIEDPYRVQVAVGAVAVVVVVAVAWDHPGGIWVS